MNEESRQKMIRTIVRREKLRPLGRLTRLFRDPLRAFPYYILASISHLKPFKISWRTLWGDRMSGFLPEANTFYYYGYCEANLTSFLLRFLKEGSTFIDVGAHIGFYSLLASRLAGESGKVWAFEPTPWTYGLLRANTATSKNVRATNAGASNRDGEIVLSDYGPGYGAYNSASAEGTLLGRAPREIRTVSVNLDRFFGENDVCPDIIKLDAEGLEHRILEGMTETLRTARPLITLEMAGGERWSENRDRSADILSRNGYMPYEMDSAGSIKRCDIRASYEYDNLLFVPQEKIGLISHLI